MGLRPQPHTNQPFARIGRPTLSSLLTELLEVAQGETVRGVQILSAIDQSDLRAPNNRRTLARVGVIDIGYSDRSARDPYRQVHMMPTYGRVSGFRRKAEVPVSGVAASGHGTNRRALVRTHPSRTSQPVLSPDRTGTHLGGWWDRKFRGRESLAL